MIPSLPGSVNADPVPPLPNGSVPLTCVAKSIVPVTCVSKSIVPPILLKSRTYNVNYY